jgi:hypothetical protein
MSVIRHHNLAGSRQQEIQYIGSSLAQNVTPIVPPSNMRAGDLVYVLSAVGSAALRSLTISTTGGQSWSSTKVRDGSVSGSTSIWVSWCTFNGTWSANPVFTISGTIVAKGHAMHAFRAPKEGAVWATDAAPSAHGVSLAGTTYTLSSITNAQNKVVTIFALDAGGDWSSTTGAFWYKLGANEYEFTGANLVRYFFAYKIQGYKGGSPGATGTCAITTNSGVTSIATRVSFYFT